MTKPQPTTADEPNHYEVLGLIISDSVRAVRQQDLKVAYHRALLRHHPDKNATVNATGKTPATRRKDGPDGADADRRAQPRTYTVDEIAAAYKTLSDPVRRADYDRELRLKRPKGGEKDGNGTMFHTGLEVVDLEDMNDDDDDEEQQQQEQVWYRSCRCGESRGFLVTEGDLEREAEHGEIVVGCRGCSLWLKILFAVEADEGEGEGG